jgi:CRP-like cAMP-binding protein
MRLAAPSVRTGLSAHHLERPPVDRSGLFGNICGVAPPARYVRKQQIAPTNSEHECWHQIVRGAARQCACRADGQRQIIDFILKGDVFVTAPAMDGEFFIDAITDGTIVASIPRPLVERLARCDANLESEWHDLALEGAYRLQRQILILGRASAMGKVSAFLLDMADRLPTDVRGGFELPMSRYDVADYLVMSVETVSRSFTSLRERGAVVFSGRRAVRILDRSALEVRETSLH